MKRRSAIKSVAALAVLPVLAAGCGSSGTKPAPKTQASNPSASTTGASARPPYDPKIDPANFSTSITNPYFSLKPGAKWVYRGTKNGTPQDVVVQVTSQTHTSLGVRCLVISDIHTQAGALVEKTTDWYAQDKQGNVWYFGEDTKEYQKGVVTSTAGTWDAGVDNAKPGVVMQAHPKAGGGFYRQEYRPGIAEDKAKVQSVSATQKVPAGSFEKVILTEDIDPLNPDKLEHKWYAPGVGMVHVTRKGTSVTEEYSLVKRTG